MENADRELWEEAERIANAIPAIPMQAFMTRMSFVMLMVADLLDVHHYATDQLVQRHMGGQMKILEDNPQILRVDNEEVRQAVQAHMEQGVRDQVSRHSQWILNQGLVSHCTFLDAFLEQTVELVLRGQPSLLVDTRAGKEASLQQVIEDGLDTVLADVAAKETSHFAHLTGIRSRIGYLESKLSMATARLFDWSNFTDGAEFAHWDLDYLCDVYDRRHKIVHHDEYSVNSGEELHEISTAFGKLLLNTARVAQDVHGIMNDMNRGLIQQQEYLRLVGEKSASQTSPPG